MFDLWDLSATINVSPSWQKSKILIWRYGSGIWRRTIGRLRKPWQTRNVLIVPLDGEKKSYRQIPFVLSCWLPNLPFSSFSHKIGPQELTGSQMEELTNWGTSFLGCFMLLPSSLTASHDGFFLFSFFFFIIREWKFPGFRFLSSVAFGCRHAVTSFCLLLLSCIRPYSPQLVQTFLTLEKLWRYKPWALSDKRRYITHMCLFQRANQPIYCY